MGKVVVRLKAIEYKENSSCYFIFLGYQVVLSSHVPLGISNVTLLYTSKHFRRFCSMGYVTEIHQNLDDMCIAKATDQDSSQELSRTSSLLSFSLVASNSECRKATSLQIASLVEESNRY